MKIKLLVKLICLLMTVFAITALAACENLIVCTHNWGEWSVTKEATCSEEGVKERTCSLCFNTETASVEKLAHTPAEDDGDCTTPVSCLVCGKVASDAAAHKGGTATCTEKAICDTCGKPYGELAAHVPGEDDGDCATAINCSLCGKVAVEATGHKGGTATCTEKATCDVCGKPYGELGAHTGEEVWMKHLNSHYYVYSCCFAKASEEEAHTIAHGACTTCGFKPSSSATSVEAAPGSTQVKIVFSITDNPGITGMTATLQYSPDVLQLVEAESADAFSALTFTAPDTLGNGCTFMWDGLEIGDKDIKDGEFLILTFTVNKRAVEGEYSVILNIKAYDNDLNPLTLTITGGMVTVKNN